MFATRISVVGRVGRSFHQSASSLTKVTVLGAAGGIGQPLSLLLKDVDAISHLALYDVVNAPGVAADLGHINTKAKVRWRLAAAAPRPLPGPTPPRLTPARAPSR